MEANILQPARAYGIEMFRIGTSLSTALGRRSVYWVWPRSFRKRAGRMNVLRGSAVEWLLAVFVEQTNAL